MSATAAPTAAITRDARAIYVAAVTRDVGPAAASGTGAGQLEPPAGRRSLATRR